MPPKIKVSKEQIDDAALCLVRENGIERVNARSIAKRLDCSVHPIFREYASMEDLKKTLYQTAEGIYNNKMFTAMSQGEMGFSQMGLAYIDFAKTEQNLFHLLFMSDAFQKLSIMDIVGNTQGDDEVIAIICKMTGLMEKAAMELYAGIWLTTHGIACMFATNNCRFNDEEIKRLLSLSFEGLVLKLKSEDKSL